MSNKEQKRREREREREKHPSKIHLEAIDKSILGVRVSPHM